MLLSPDAFTIDCPAVTTKLETFIRESMLSLRRTGIVVPLSGGLDSSTVAALCARAVGAENVTGLMMPDLKGSPDALRFGRRVVKDLGIRARTVNTTAVLLAVGAYRFVANLVPSRKLLSAIVKKRLAASGESFFREAITGSDERTVRQACASIYAKQRIRMVVVYRYADLNRLMVAGTAHKSEDLLGLYVKFGIDDSADIMPLKQLYRSHILQIARFVGVPPYVMERTPNPEMLPGIEDKYLDVLGVPSEMVDLVLLGLEREMSDEAIAAQTGITVGKAAELREIVRLSAHMRSPSMSLDPLEGVMKPWRNSSR